MLPAQNSILDHQLQAIATVLGQRRQEAHLEALQQRPLQSVHRRESDGEADRPNQGTQTVMHFVVGGVNEL